MCAVLEMNYLYEQEKNCSIAEKLGLSIITVLFTQQPQVQLVFHQGVLWLDHRRFWCHKQTQHLL